MIFDLFASSDLGVSTFVPLLELLLVEMRGFDQLVQLLRGKLRLSARDQIGLAIAWTDVLAAIFFSLVLSSPA